MIGVAAVLLCAVTQTAWAGAAVRGEPADDNDHVKPVLSSDGRHALWLTGSNDLAEELLHNPDGDLFVVRSEVDTDKLTLVTHRHKKLDVSFIDVEERVGVSGNGHTVAFGCKHGQWLGEDLKLEKKKTQVFMRDLEGGDVKLVSHVPESFKTGGEHGSSFPAMSDDGSVVAYVTTSHSIIGRKKRPHKRQIFAYDSNTGKSQLISHAAASEEEYADSDCATPAVSPDGRFVAFVTSSDGLVSGVKAKTTQIYLYDRTTLKSTLVSHKAGSDSSPASGGDCTHPTIGQDGGETFVAFLCKSSDVIAGADGNSAHVYLWSSSSGAVEMVDTGADADAQTPTLSANAQYLAFASTSAKLAGPAGFGKAQCFTYERASKQIKAVPAADLDEDCTFPYPANNGRIVFATKAKNAASGVQVSGKRSHVYMYDPAGNGVKLLSRTGSVSSPQGEPTLQFRHACIDDSLELDVIGGTSLGDFTIMGGFSGSKTYGYGDCKGTTIPISPWGKNFQIQFDSEGGFHMSIPSSKLSPFFGTICKELTGLILDLSTCEYAVGG